MAQDLQTRIHNLANIYLGLVALQTLADDTEVHVDLMTDDLIERCADIGTEFLAMGIDDIPPYIKAWAELVKDFDSEATVYPADLGQIAVLHDLHPELGDDVIIGRVEMYPPSLQPLYEQVAANTTGSMSDIPRYRNLEKVATAPSITMARQSILVEATRE